jgi:ABC-type Na+ efflux pump permease subunit
MYIAITTNISMMGTLTGFALLALMTVKFRSRHIAAKYYEYTYTVITAWFLLILTLWVHKCRDLCLKY